VEVFSFARCNSWKRWRKWTTLYWRKASSDRFPPRCCWRSHSSSSSYPSRNPYSSYYSYSYSSHLFSSCLRTFPFYPCSSSRRFLRSRRSPASPDWFFPISHHHRRQTKLSLLLFLLLSGQSNRNRRRRRTSSSLRSSFILLFARWTVSAFKE